MPILKSTKTVNADSSHLWTGIGDVNDEYIATQGIFQIRGGGGDDKLTGNDRSDTFIFESSQSANGTDTLTNFKVFNPLSSVQDTLDLSLALGKSLKINSTNVDNYIWLKDGALYVDSTGSHSDSAGVWAYLEGVQDMDQIHVRATNFDGKITADGGFIDPNEDISPSFGYFDLFYNENVQYSDIVLWDEWGLSIDAIDAKYNGDQYHFLTNPYTCLAGRFEYEGATLPEYNTSDIASVTLYEDSADKTFTLDFFGIKEWSRVSDKVVYDFMATISSSEVPYTDIDSGDYLTVTLVGGQSFQIDHYDDVFV